MNVFGIIVVVDWFLVSVLAVLGFAGYLLYRHEKCSGEVDVNLVVVSLGARHVLPSLFKSIDWHERMLRGGEKLYVVVDEDKAELDAIRDYIRGRERVELVVVPPSYKTRAVAKGRAIQYFIETHVREDEWYAFLDDDNLILTDDYRRDAFCYSRKGRLVGNPVLTPRLGKSNASYVMDHIRLWDDLTIFRAFLGVLGRPYPGLHGELLLTRGDVLKHVTFKRESIVEDFSFGVSAYKAGYRFFQTETRVSILSPHSVRDLIRQRNRWWCGLRHEIPRAGAGFILVAGVRLVLWRIGVFGTMAFLPLHYLLGVGGWHWFIAFLPGLVYYLSAYLTGVYRVYRQRGVLDALKVFLLLPAYGVLENLAPWLRCRRGFVVIDKS